MNEESIRIAIAKICYPQYSHIEPTYDYTLNTDYEKDWVWVIKEDVYYNTALTLPDYYNSLDAMHEAETVLMPFTSDDWQAYAYWLAHITPLGGQDHATAPQKCEAFLRTKGKWDEKK